MVRAIDGNALIEWFRPYLHTGEEVPADVVIENICSMPTLTPPNEPLTLERLREMDGQPVRMEDLTGGTLWNQWIIFERHTDDGFIPRGGGYFGCDSYGVKWLAYAYLPIDREKWTAEWEEDGECHHKPYRVRDAEKWKKYKCSKCGYKAGRRTSQKYCPSCGRAMTPEAWELLEKRLRG